jgi:hypothetical protein
MEFLLKRLHARANNEGGCAGFRAAKELFDECAMNSERCRRYVMAWQRK